jgi:release factor glutamine methyltransferase
MLLCKRYSQNEPISIFDIGTGSGNIAISIAKYVKHAHITTIDINNEALIIAKQNAVFHSVESRIQFSCTDIFNQSDELFKPRFDLLVSNPPYVPKDEWEQLQVEVRDYEPASALTDGLDGYKFYHRIIEIIPSILKPNGSVVLEVGYGQAEIVARELKEAGLEQLNITNDLQGIPRVVSGIWMVQPKIYISLN